MTYCASLKLYRAKDEGATVLDELVLLAIHTESQFEMVESIEVVGEDKDEIFLRVQWSGLPDECDWTWLGLKDLH